MQDYTLRWLEGRQPDDPNPRPTFGYDLNGEGVAVGNGWGDWRPGYPHNTGLHPIIWYLDHTEVTPPGSPGPTALNDRGDMVGLDSRGDIGFGSSVYFDGTLLSLVDRFGVPDINVVDINNRRIVTGYYGATHYTNARAFIFNAETGGTPWNFDLLGDDSARCTSGWRINGNDHVIGYTADTPQYFIFNVGWAPPGFLTTFFYADNTVVDLEDRITLGLTDDDVVVGGRRSATTGHTTAFALKADAETLTDEDLGVLPDLGHNYSCANDINNLGDIVGVSSTQAGQPGRAFLLTNDGTMLDLNTVVPPESGWTLESGVRINDSGQILCQGTWTHPEFPSANGGLEIHATCLLTPELHIPFRRPERQMGDRYSLTAGSSGVWFGPGTRPVPINPNELWDRELWQRLTPEKRDIMVALRISELGAQIGDAEARAQVESAARAIIADVVDKWGAP